VKTHLRRKDTGDTTVVAGDEDVGEVNQSTARRTSLCRQAADADQTSQTMKHQVKRRNIGVITVVADIEDVGEVNPSTARRTSKDVGDADQTNHDVVNQTTTTKHQVKIHPTRKDTGDITVVVDEEDAGEVNRKIKIQENQTIRQEVRLVVARVQKSRKTDRQSEDLRRSLTTRTIEVGQNLMVMMMRRMTMDVVVDVAVDLDVVDSGVEEAVEASGRHSASSFLVSLNVMLCITFNLCILVLRVRLHYT